MVVLDTNVISALMQPRPKGEVVTWLDKTPTETVWTTSVTVFEALYGIRAMPQGKRQRELESAFLRLVEDDLDHRVLGLDRIASAHAADIASELKSLGKSVEMRDTLIAGIVSANGALLATRNIKHFSSTGIRLVNPWDGV